MYEQSAYYYIRKLVSIGAIGESGTYFVKGGTAKLYTATSPAFGIEMEWGEKLSIDYNLNDWKKTTEFLAARKFLKEFIDENNKFDGLVIVDRLILTESLRHQLETDIMQFNWLFF